MDDMRKHRVHGVDALLSNLRYDLVEGFEGIWSRSVGERCKVSELGTLEDVLVPRHMSMSPSSDQSPCAYLHAVVDSHHGKADGTGL